MSTDGFDNMDYDWAAHADEKAFHGDEKAFHGDEDTVNTNKKVSHDVTENSDKIALLQESLIDETELELWKNLGVQSVKRLASGNMLYFVIPETLNDAIPPDRKDFSRPYASLINGLSLKIDRLLGANKVHIRTAVIKDKPLRIANRRRKDALIEMLMSESKEYDYAYELLRAVIKSGAFPELDYTCMRVNSVKKFREYLEEETKGVCMNEN